MTTPQLENGYTRLANELLDEFISAGLTSRQWAVLMAIVRKTYGYNKTEDDIGLSQLSEMTGIAKGHVSVTVRELESMKIINRKVGVFGHNLSVNKKYKSWKTSNKKVTESVPVTETVTVTDSVTEGLPNQYQGGYRIGKNGVTESVTTKDNLTKDNQKTTPKDILASQTMRDRFNRFYSAYPKKKSRGQAEKAFAKLNPDEQLLAEMISGIERAMKSETWQNPKFISYPATWINDQGWLDEIQTEFNAPERAVIQAFNSVLGEQLGVIDELIFIEQRAAAIRDFLTLSGKPDFHSVYFSWVRDRCDLPPHVGFDWLISRSTFTKIKGGQYERLQSA